MCDKISVKRRAVEFLLLICTTVTVLGCRKAASSIVSEEDTDFSNCYWYERCSPEGLRQYPGGNLDGCIETIKCLRAKNSDSTDNNTVSDQCELLIEKAYKGSCDIDTIKNVIFSSTCLANRVGMGEDCNGSSLNCKLGLACLPVNADKSMYTCQASLELNDQCLDNDIPEWTIDINIGVCGKENFCSKDTYKCERKHELGLSCDSATQCESDRCDSTGICIPLGKAGDDCTYHNDCEETVGLLCISGTCQILRNEGDACTMSTDPINECRIGLVCVEGICTKVPCRPAKLGEPCSDVCEEGLYCNYQTNTCKEEANEGQSCEVDPCKEGLYCNDTMVCASQKPVDAGCDQSEECHSGHCRDGGCATE